MDFKHNLAELSREMMVDAGVKVSEDWDDYYTCVKYLELHHRWFDSSVPYIVLFSKELQEKLPCLSKNELAALQDIIYRLKNCLPIMPYMSKDIYNPKTKKSDFLLKNWNIYHLHLEKRSIVKRFTNPNLLFFQCEGQAVHMIDIKPHPTGAKWFDRELFEIIDDNWPWLLRYYPGAISGGPTDDSKVHNALKNQFCLVSFRGRALVPTNLGVASSGDSNLAVRNVDNLLNKLKACEAMLKKEEEEIRQEINRSMSIIVTDPLDYTLIVENGFFVAYEKHSNAKIRLFKAE